jgi:hypothetical protein
MAHTDDRNILSCQQAEALLAEYIEGALPGFDQRRVESHVSGCAACRASIADMRLAFQVSRAAVAPELPEGLVARILEATSGIPETKIAPSWRTRMLERVGPFFRPMLEPFLEPRLVMGLAMTIVSCSLVLNLLGLDIRRVEMADLKPSRLYWSVNRQMHLAGARVSKAYNDLRVVYEIQTQLQALRGDAPAAADEPAQPEPKKQDDNRPRPQTEERHKQQNRRWSSDVRLLAAAMPVTLSLRRP